VTEKSTPPEKLTEEELEGEEAEELPERETMMVVDPGGGIGLDPIPWSDGEAPDDRYEQ
jgi:hypothetical protein